MVTPPFKWSIARWIGAGQENIGFLEVICMVVTRYEGGTAMYRGELTEFRECWVFDDGKKGTARINIRVETCDEAQRKKNRERVDAALAGMWKSVQMKRAAEAAGR